MNIDLHSHFFPVEALQNPGKYRDRAPKVVLENGKLSVTSQIGFRPGLGPGAYDPVARIKALDEMSIDLQAISPSPILLFYWEEPAVAAHRDPGDHPVAGPGLPRGCAVSCRS